jgi:RND family efflux transporter MFP subunit
MGTAREASETAVIQIGDVHFVVNVAGEIGPAEQVSVRPEVNGRINELPVDVGDRVAKGGLLFALDDRDLSIEVETRQKDIESARLQLEKARISMEQAKRDFERNKELYDARLLSAQEYESSRQLYDSSVKDHELAMNSIERSQKDLALAQERLQKTRIEAPFDCTVLTRPVSVGQAVSGSGGFNSGTEVLTIADLSSMVINAHVNQADVTHLKQGAEVAVEVDAVPGLVIRGEVERIAPQATTHNNLKGYATRIALKDLDPRVQPGMTATISIPVATAQDVLVAPLAAVFSELGDRYVYVRRDGQFVRQPVIVGVSDFFHAELKSGVSEGDEVALVEPLGAVESRREENGRSSAQTPRPRNPAASTAGSDATTRPAAQGAAGSRPATTSTTSGTQTTGTRSGT